MIEKYEVNVEDQLKNRLPAQEMLMEILLTGSLPKNCFYTRKMKSKFFVYGISFFDTQDRKNCVDFEGNRHAQLFLNFIKTTKIERFSIQLYYKFHEYAEHTFRNHINLKEYKHD